MPRQVSRARWTGDARVTYRRDGARLAVLVDDPKRCASCTAIEVLDAARGGQLHRAPVDAIIAPRFASIGLAGDAAWVFEHVPPRTTEFAARPSRWQYEAHDLARGKRRPKPPADLGLGDTTLWAMAPRFDGDGVIALGRRGRQLVWLRADAAP